MSSQTYRVELDGQMIEYAVTKSEDATQPRIDVGIHGVTVVVPAGSDADPETFLQDHAEWVLEKRAKYEEYLEAVPERRFEPGETFPYLGESYELVVESRSASQIEDGAIRLAAHHVEQTSIKQALRQFYRRKAREMIEKLVEEHAANMDVEYEKLEIRNQRTKWGSCSSSGTLGINWRLIMAPPEILEYVVIHELAHLQESNHTKEFWRLVGKYDPDYAEHADWLEDNSARLIFSDEDL